MWRATPKVFVSVSAFTGVAALVFATGCADRDALAPRQKLEASQVANDAPNVVGPYGVGHTTIQFVHTGNAGERRSIDVHVWYPSHPVRVMAAPLTSYQSRLLGLPLVPGVYDALAFSIPSPLAREKSDIDTHGPKFPLLIWSHGSLTDALDHAFTAEAIASHGFVVAAPQHTNNSQDDALVDFLNQLAGTAVLACLDGLPSPCSNDGATIAASVRNRVRDVSALIDEFTHSNAARFAGRIDVERVGVIGHSRGMLTALTTVAGNEAAGITIEPRIDAIMTMSAGRLTFTADELATVRVPVLMMVGGSDEAQGLSAVRAFFDMLTGTTRVLVAVTGAEHLSFGSTLCARLQAAGAVRLTNPRAIFEDRTVRTLLIPTPASFGSALDFCPYDSFVSPVDIRSLVHGITGVEVTPTNVPRTQDVNEVSRLSALLAVAFFGAALDDHGSDALRFTRFLTPKYLLSHESQIQLVETILANGATCPLGHGCTSGN